jgi:hypothetical protein
MEDSHKFSGIVTRNFLYKEYIECRKTALEISEQVGCSEQFVRSKLYDFQISRNKINLIGCRFDRLCVFGMFHKLLEKRPTWICLCDCGTIYFSHTSQLNNGFRRSCGCLRRETRTKICESINNKKLPLYGEIYATFWKGYIDGALERNLEFDITPKYAWDILVTQNFRCAFSGVEISVAKIGSIRANKNSYTASIDRIDSNKGYIVGNIQWVHKRLNMMKVSLSDDNFINWCCKISNYQQNKNVFV